MKSVKVAASTKEYDVLIGCGLLEDAARYVRAAVPAAVSLAIVTDDIVDALYADGLCNALKSAGCNVYKYVLPHGEQSKNGDGYLSILSFLARSGLTRSDALIALGGGMVGDIAAFSAATYLRGIKYIQIPTTLLAMVDSSVGGKAAIDLPEGKNLAGAFCQPELVLADTAVLASLPEGILRDGCAELLKYGILGDAVIFDSLLEKGLDFDREELIYRAVSMKRDYVCADEFDKGPRRMLNLGHTLGHALEAQSGYALSHGCAVSIGLACVCRAAAACGYCGAQLPQRVIAALEKLGLPTRTDADIDSLMPLMLSDKKRSGAVVNVVVPESPGGCKIIPMDESTLKSFMKAGL